MMNPRDKYNHDPQYHILVDFMIHEIERCNYTPSEMREAAVLACILYEQYIIRDYHLELNKETKEALDILHFWVEKKEEEDGNN